MEFFTGSKRDQAAQALLWLFENATSVEYKDWQIMVSTMTRTKNSSTSNPQCGFSLAAGCEFFGVDAKRGAEENYDALIAMVARYRDAMEAILK